MAEMGATMIMNTVYPSPDGNDLYPDQKKWEVAQAMTRIKGRLLPAMNALAWEQTFEVFDVKYYSPKEDNGVFGPGIAIGMLLW